MAKTKTGGTTGSNQYQVRGNAKASQSVAAVSGGGAPDLMAQAATPMPKPKILNLVFGLDVTSGRDGNQGPEVLSGSVADDDQSDHETHFGGTSTHGADTDCVQEVSITLSDEDYQKLTAVIGKLDGVSQRWMDGDDEDEDG